MRNTARRSHFKRGLKVKGKSQNKTRLAVVALLLIVLIIATGNIFRLAKNLFQPISQTQKEYRWDGASRINLVIKSSEVAVLSFDPAEKSVVYFDIPSDTYLDVPGGFGNWQIRSIYELGQSENPPIGVKLLTESTSSFLGLPIDGYLQIDGQNTETVVSELRAPFKSLGLVSNLKTNLTPIELFRLELGLSGVRFDKVESFNLSEMDDVLSDPSKMDYFITKNFADSQIKNEQVTVAVFNATDTPGLAAKAAREITNMGGNVIIQTNSQVKVPQTIISGKDGYTKRRLQQAFCEKSKCDNIPPNGFDFRAQVNIILGQDFASK